MVKVPVSIKRTYRLFYILSAFYFFLAVIAFLLDQIEIVISLAALAVALYALGNFMKTEEIKWLWWGRVRSQKLESIEKAIHRLEEKIDESLKLSKKEK